MNFDISSKGLKALLKGSSINPDSGSSSKSLLETLGLIKDLLQNGGNEDASSAIGEIMSIASGCDKHNIASALSRLVKFLKYKEPLVQMCAVICIVKLFELAKQVLSDPNTSATEKVKLAKELCNIFNGDLKEHMGLFSHDDQSLIASVMQLAMLTLVGGGDNNSANIMDNSLTNNNSEKTNKNIDPNQLLLDKWKQKMVNSLSGIQNQAENLLNPSVDSFNSI